MRKLSFQVETLLALLLLVVVTGVDGQVPSDPPGGKPEEWVTESLRGRITKASSAPFEDPFVTGSGFTGELLSRAPVPDVNAADAVWVERIESTTKEMRETLQEAGVVVPSGTLFLPDDRLATLAVHARASDVEKIRKVAGAAFKRFPQGVVIHARVIEAEGGVLRKMVRETMLQPDHAAQSSRLMELVEQGSARSLGEIRVETRFGQKVMGQSAIEAAEMVSLLAGDVGIMGYRSKMHPAGFCLEAEPSLTSDDSTVGLACTVRFQNAPSISRFESINLGASRRLLQMPVVDHFDTHLVCQTTFSADGSKLLGTWTPHGKANPEGRDVMRALLMDVQVLTVLPAENTELKAVLTRLAGKAKVAMANAVGAAAGVPDETAAPRHLVGETPPGMEVREFGVNSRFLTGSASPVTPLSSKETPRFQVREFTPAHHLHEAGIAFPEGAQCVFVAATMKLIVRNTPVNLDAIQALLDSPRFRMPPVLQHTLHIVQGDGPTLRRLAAALSKTEDPATAWRSIEALAAAQPDQVQIIETARLETQSGQRVHFETGEDHMTAGPLEFDRSEKMAGGKDTATAPSPVPTRADGMRSENSIRRVGLSYEVEPTADPDGRIIDCNLSLEYHYAPPSAVPDATTPGAPRFHCARFVIPTTLQSGVPMVIGQWQPTGVPEFDGKDLLQMAVLRVDCVWMPEASK